MDDLVRDVVSCTRTEVFLDAGEIVRLEEFKGATMYRAGQCIEGQAELVVENAVPGSWNVLNFGMWVQAYWRSSSALLLERKCYGELFELIGQEFQSGRRIALVIGNPGIGKSAFLIYVLWQLVQAGSKILLQNSAGERILLEQKGDHYTATANINDDFRDVLSSDKGLYYLVDGHLPQPPYFVGKLILTCSPLTLNYKEINKSGRRTVFYMPTWSPAELAAADKAIFHHGIDSWGARYKKWGGVARFVLEQTDQEADTSLVLSINYLQKALSPDGYDTLSMCADECVLHMLVREDYKAFEYVLASGYVEGKFRNLLCTSIVPGLQAFLLSGSPSSGLLRGFGLEVLFQIQLSEGAPFVTKKICRGSELGEAEIEYLGPLTNVRLDKKRRTYAYDSHVYWSTVAEQWDCFKLRKDSMGNVSVDIYCIKLTPPGTMRGRSVEHLKADLECSLGLEIAESRINFYIVTLEESKWRRRISWDSVFMKFERRMMFVSIKQ